MKKPKEENTESDSGREEADWANNVTDNIVEVVGKVQGGIVGSIKPLAKVIAYAPLFLLVLVSIITLATIGVFRLVDIYLPADTWVAHFILGGAFVFLGLLFWSRRPKLPKKNKG